MKNTFIHLLSILALVAISFGCGKNIQENSGNISFTSNEKSVPKAITQLVDYSNKKSKATYQDNQFTFFVRGAYHLFTTQTKLDHVADVADLIPNFPSGWIDQYIAVELCLNDDETIYSSPNNRLTQEQINLLQSAPIGTDIKINVKYSAINSATNKSEVQQMEPMEVTIIPETEAEYTKGVKNLITWFEDNFKDKISEEEMAAIRVSLEFVIDKNGDIHDIEFTSTEDDQKIIQSIEEVVSNMPKWTPAKDRHNQPVDQKFQLVVGRLMGC